MSKTKRTRTWALEPRECGLSVRNTDGQPIADVYGTHPGSSLFPTDEECRRHAALIVAAPEMQTALRELHRRIGSLQERFPYMSVQEVSRELYDMGEVAGEAGL